MWRNLSWSLACTGKRYEDSQRTQTRFNWTQQHRFPSEKFDIREKRRQLIGASIEQFKRKQPTHNIPKADMPVWTSYSIIICKLRSPHLKWGKTLNLNVDFLQHFSDNNSENRFIDNLNLLLWNILRWKWCLLSNSRLLDHLATEPYHEGWDSISPLLNWCLPQVSH